MPRFHNIPELPASPGLPAEEAFVGIHHDPTTGTWAFRSGAVTATNFISATTALAELESVVEGHAAASAPGGAMVVATSIVPRAAGVAARGSVGVGCTAPAVARKVVAPSSVMRVRICCNGGAGGKHVLLLSRTGSIDELLDRATHKLSGKLAGDATPFVARRVFTIDGYELGDAAEAIPGEVLCVSAGEDFVPH